MQAWQWPQYTMAGWYIAVWLYLAAKISFSIAAKYQAQPVLSGAAAFGVVTAYSAILFGAQAFVLHAGKFW